MGLECCCLAEDNVMPEDLHRLPKLRDSLSFLYIEHAVIEQDDMAIRVIRADGHIPVPIAAMTV